MEVEVLSWGDERRIVPGREPTDGYGTWLEGQQVAKTFSECIFVLCNIYDHSVKVYNAIIHCLL